MSELMSVTGIDYLGPLPAEVQFVTVFSAGIHAAAPAAEAARAAEVPDRARKRRRCCARTAWSRAEAGVDLSKAAFDRGTQMIGRRATRRLRRPSDASKP